MKLQGGILGHMNITVPEGKFSHEWVQAIMGVRKEGVRAGQERTRFVKRMETWAKCLSHYSSNPVNCMQWRLETVLPFVDR